MPRRTKPAKTEVPDTRAAARKSSKNEEARMRDLERRLAEALEQQSATSEILRVISMSPTDTQPVFDEIVSSARRLLHGHSAAITRVLGEQVHLVAATTTGGHEEIQHRYPLPVPEVPLARERAVFIIADTERDPRYA